MTVFLGYIAFFAAMFLFCWARYRDVFHPWIIFIPQFIFLNAILPLTVFQEDPRKFALYAGGEFLVWYQALTLVLPLCLLLGAEAALRGANRSTLRWKRQVIPNADMVRMAAVTFGALAMSGWLYMVFNVGGFEAAYGYAKGGGWAPSGYVREMRFLGIVGVLLIFLQRTGRGMRPEDWAIVIFCILPVLVHGLLGARRGPTLIAIVMLAGGYLYFMRRRVNLAVVVTALFATGALALFLVVNRGVIYLGSELNDLRGPAEFLDRWNSNEYLIGSAVVRYAEVYGGFYGARELTHLLGRFIPAAIWPNVYEDLSALFGLGINLQVNAGIDPGAIYGLAGWLPSIGSATGFVGALWLEFQYVAPFVAFLIGYAYGRLWRRAAVSLAARAVYLLMVALSVYLVMQDIDAWLYRLVLLGLPLLIVLWRLGLWPQRRARSGGARVSGRPRALRPGPARAE